VGRGAAQAYCILMGPDQPSAKMQQRLDAMCETNDGFRIAEADLQLRGPGDFLGTKQSGLPEFKLADVVEDSALVHEARDAAFALIREDPELAAPAHAGLRHQVQQFVAEHQLQALMA
jgi:ATP-dependent DNA helicase RecG